MQRAAANTQSPGDDEPAPLVIAIDGPGGAGKSSVSREVARRLGVGYVDTGAIYRAVTLKALRRQLDPARVTELVEMIQQTLIQLVEPVAADEGARQRVILDGEDVTEAIRDPQVSRQVSRYAALAPVREALIELQRELARRGPVVMEGRDIGTVVCPQAHLKFFLDASLQARAQRRLDELVAGGVRTSFDETRRDLEARDRLDSSRSWAPLVRAPEAIYVDTTNLSFEEVVEQIVARVRRRYQRQEDA